MSRCELSVSRWLDAHSDRSAHLKTFPSLVILGDVVGDGEHRLVLADVNLDQEIGRSRYKVYKGTILTSDQPLPDIPSSVICFYGEEHQKVPSVGVTCGSDLLVYKNNKPFFKYSVPGLPVEPFELDIWTKLYEGGDFGGAVEGLKEVNFEKLTPRSQQLLNTKPEDYPEFIQRYRNVDLQRPQVINCATTLSRHSLEPNATACPILATETGQIYFLDPHTFTVLHEASISSTTCSPTILCKVGLFDIEYRLLVATREGYICLLRRGWLEGRVLMHTNVSIVDMLIVPGDNFIALATTDKMLTCYTKRGNKLWSMEMKQNISCLSLIPLKHLSVSFVAVGLHGGMVQIYKGRVLVDSFSVADTPSCLTFGQMGQEEHVLVVIALDGTLDLKILKRTADFTSSKSQGSLPALQNKPLPLPKRSKLFLEQSARERQNAVEIHRTYQQDLIRLRLEAARAMVNNLSDQTGVGNEQELIKLSAQVLGLGPKFSLILNVENINNKKALMGLSIVFHCDPAFYKLSQYFVPLPLVPPSLTYKVMTKVDEVSFRNSANANKDTHIKVFCIRKDEVRPLISATVNMPPTDTLIPLLD